MPDKKTKKGKENFLAALALLGESGEAPKTAADVGIMSATRPRSSLETLKQHNSWESFNSALEKKLVNPPVLLAQLFGWNHSYGEELSRPAKTVTKALAKLLEQNYMSGVEMAAFASASSKLLEPDRLAKLIAHAESTACSYGPPTSQVTLSADLEVVLSRYREDRRLTLLRSLWDAARGGFWFDQLGIVLKPHSSRRKFVKPDLAETGCELKDRMLFERNPGFMTHELDAIGGLEWTAAERDALAGRLRRDDVPAGLVVASSKVAALEVGQRAPTPIAEILAITAASLNELVESGTFETAIPAKPTSWDQLCLGVDNIPFPVPAELSNVFGRASKKGSLPNITSETRVLGTPSELETNSEVMRNCTNGWRSRSESGQAFIVYAEYLTPDPQDPSKEMKEQVNIELIRTPNNRWETAQINRFANSGRPAQPVLNAIQQMVKAVNDQL